MFNCSLGLSENMHVPEVKRCCFCFPLRYGIIFFGYINIIFSLFAVACLVITTELQRSRIMNDSSLEVVTLTVLFSIFGMSVILNILLLVAGYQKDISMLRLYNYYAMPTVLAALVLTTILLLLMMIYDVLAALFAIAMQCYVMVLVRSEIVKLEQKQIQSDKENQLGDEEAIDIPDMNALLST